MKSPNVTEVEISPELLSKLEAVDDTAHKGIEWTPELDAALLKYWPVKHKEQLAKALGMSERSARNRYRELTGGEK